MKNSYSFIKIFLVKSLFLYSVSYTQTDSDIDNLDKFIKIEKLSDRTLVIKTGVFYFDAVTAIATQKGIVVFDAGFAPSLTKKYRGIIEKEFSRNDFAYLINTHGHWDHTNGNKIFPETMIIGYEGCERELKKDYSNKEQLLDRFKRTLDNYKEIVNASDLTTDYGQQMIYRTLLYEIAIKDVEADYTFAYPSLTFNDKLTLDLGDVMINLYYFGKAHSQSDIVSYIPEENLLMSGDLFNSGGGVNFSQLNAGNVTKPDVTRWHKVMQILLSNDCEIEQILDGHAATLTRDDLVAFNSNVESLWNDFKAGRELSARIKLERVYHKGGLEEMLETYNDMKTIYKNDYYYFESSLNDFGYHLIRGNQVKAAIEVFKIAIEHFPDSWNLFDSLGEAYLADGQTELAIKNYEKSLELNPNNINGSEILENIKSSK